MICFEIRITTMIWISKSDGEIDCNIERFQLPVLIRSSLILWRWFQIKQHHRIKSQLPLRTSSSYLEQWLKILIVTIPAMQVYLKTTLKGSPSACSSCLRRIWGISKQHCKIKLYIWRWLKEIFSASLDLSNEKVYKMCCFEWNAFSQGKTIQGKPDIKLYSFMLILTIKTTPRKQL